MLLCVLHNFEIQENLMIANSEQEELLPIDTEADLEKHFSDIQQRCLKLENFQDAGMTVQEMIKVLEGPVLKAVQSFHLFSPNQTLKEVHTEHMKFLALPYHLGWLYGRSQQPRRRNVETSRTYLTTFLELMEGFDCEQQSIFPKSFLGIWKEQQKEASYRPPRDQLVQAMKQNKLIEQRYRNNTKIREESEQRQAIRDFLTLQVHSSLSQLRAIHEELQILAYKDSIEKDPQVKEQHESEMAKPIPKIKVMKVPAKEEIRQLMVPSEKRTELVTQVWQENANKPTMSLSEVAQLEYENMVAREQRQARERQANKQDSDEEKQHVDDRIKHEQRAWDDWKDAHEKGAGNRNGR